MNLIANIVTVLNVKNNKISITSKRFAFFGRFLLIFEFKYLLTDLSWLFMSATVNKFASQKY